MPPRDMQYAMRHANARTTTRYDMARANLDRHAAHAVAAYLAGMTSGSGIDRDDQRVSEPDTADALHVQAQRALLDGLRRGDALRELERAVRHSQTRQFTPDLAILQVGVVALDLARVARSEPIAKSELVEQHLT